MINHIALNIYYRIFRFPGSESYWKQRYLFKGTSGAGSYGRFAEFKAEVINDFVRRNDIESVIEFGCGDGNQLMNADYPKYLGFDVSPTAISTCRHLFKNDPTKHFRLLSEYDGEMAELALSLDVIYHLVEDNAYESHMCRLFESALRFVIIYSSNTDEPLGRDLLHIRHRRFTDWIERSAPGWTLMRYVPNRYPYSGDHENGSFADFYIYRRSD